MKKIFSMAALFAAGLLGFTSCSNDDVAQGGAFSQDALAVSFAAVKTDGAVTPAKGPLLSRAAGVTTTSLTNIYVQATNSENAVYFGDGTPELFTYDGSSEFRSTTNHYWPNNTAQGANNTLNFYASNQQEALTAGTQANPSPIVDDYECDGIKDWVTATVKAGEKTIPYPLTFQHVLSQIKITAEAKDKTQDLVYKVVGVKLSAPNTGDYQFANATAGVGTWTIDNSSSADYTYEQNMNGQFNPTAATEAEQTWASTDYFNILPVTSGTLTFDVQYQVIQNGQVIGDFTGANSKQVTVDAPNLLSGKIYTYNFVLAINTNDVITFTVSTNSWTDGSTTDVQVPEPLDPNGHEYVEIGGIKWATMNVGATSIADAGLFFQWGDTQGYTANQVGNSEGNKSFISSDYKYKDVTSSEIIKYNLSDGKTVLDIEDDAVRANWGGDWRLPNKEEFTTLTDACTSQWIENYQSSGVNGILLTDKTDVSKTLFFPASGYYIEDKLKVKGSTGIYWSRSRNANDIYKAHTLSISSSNCSIALASRYYGLSIRGVLAE